MPTSSQDLYGIPVVIHAPGHPALTGTEGTVVAISVDGATVTIRTPDGETDNVNLRTAHRVAILNRIDGGHPRIERPIVVTITPAPIETDTGRDEDDEHDTNVTTGRTAPVRTRGRARRTARRRTR